MLFNSLAFLIFITVFFLGWRFVREHNTSRWLYLIAFSFFFYGWWDWRFVALLIMSGGIDYLAGLAIIRWPKHKLIFLVVSMSGNVGSLLLFKYLDFFLTNINWSLTAMGCADQIPLARLILPIGISFYTFQSMSYTIDVYRGHLQPTRNILHFFAFISIFPHLVAGPINRAVDLLPQLTRYIKPTEQVRWDGLKLIAMGYFKKMVIADNLAPIVNAAFASTAPMQDTLYWWVVMMMFAFQIYGDFSGYTDIARGLGKWIGYEFMVNFNHPYVSASAREFWTRWHISLSTWFRDYVYIPLGGSRKGVWHGHRNMWITMLVSGLWHGANWTFVIWAALHSFYMSLERVTRWPERVLRLRGGRHLATIIVFVLVLLAWVFFRARSFSQATWILGNMFSFHTEHLKAAMHLLTQNAWTVLALALVIEVAVHLKIKAPTLWLPRMAPVVSEILLVAVLLTTSLFLRGPGATFIYFQF
jgi:D-alanyl-lipoteichoic acid acyltransferase DltB (MBOAT superfamily)